MYGQFSQELELFLKLREEKRTIGLMAIYLV